MFKSGKKFEYQTAGCGFLGMFGAMEMHKLVSCCSDLILRPKPYVRHIGNNYQRLIFQQTFVQL